MKNLLDEAAERGGLVICPVVYVELRGFPRATASYVDSFLDETGILADWTFDKAICSLQPNDMNDTRCENANRRSVNLSGSAPILSLALTPFCEPTCS